MACERERGLKVEILWQLCCVIGMLSVALGQEPRVPAVSVLRLGSL